MAREDRRLAQSDVEGRDPEVSLECAERIGERLSEVLGPYSGPVGTPLTTVVTGRL